MSRRSIKDRRKWVKSRRRLRFEQFELRCLLAVGLPGLVSVEATGTETGNDSSSTARQSLSANGRFEVFTSSAANLVSGVSDTNGTDDVFLRDTLNVATQLVSGASPGATGNGVSDQPVISADGRFVAFRSTATDLGTADSNTSADVFLWERATGNISLASANIAENDGGNDDSFSPSISGDGTIVAFASEATDLVAGFVNDNGADADIFVRDVSENVTQLVSSDETGTSTGNSFSFDPIVSEDGSTIVFESRSSNLVAGVIDVNEADDIYAYDVATGTKEALSLETSDNVTGNNQSAVDLRQTTSDDGRYHVFTSQATNLDIDTIDGNGVIDVFLFDTQTGLTKLISATPSGQSANAVSDQPVISADGNFVAFRSAATDLGTADSDSSTDIFHWERSTGNIVLASPNGSGSDGGNGNSSSPSIGGDGRIVAFFSRSSNLVVGITIANGGVGDVYARDVFAGTTTLVSSNSNGTATGNGASSGPLVSQDSSTIVFESLATDLVIDLGDTNNAPDIFAYDVATGSNEAISVEAAGNVSGNGGSSIGARQFVSDDGRFYVFASRASNLDISHTDVNGFNDVYLFDAVTGTKTLVSVTPSGKAGNGFSDQPVLSADGNFVAFRSVATDLDSSDNDEFRDVFLWERATGQVTLLSANATGSDEGAAESFRPSINGDGSLVAFASAASNLVDGFVDANSAGTDVFYHDVSAGVTHLVSGNVEGNASGNSQSFDPIISDDGSTIVFKSVATDLVDGVVDGNFENDLFSFDVSSGAIEVLTVEFDGNFSGNGTSETTQRQTSSDDGRYHVYTSEAYNLDSNAVDARRDSVYLYDAVARTSSLVSKTPTGDLANGVSDQPVISADGNFVAFRSTTTNFGTVDNDQNEDIYLWERATDTTTLISINQAGTAGGDHDSQNPSISGDGSVIAFQSRATDLVAGITDASGTEDVFVRSVNSGQTALVSSNDTETATGNGSSFDPIVSEDGSSVIFVSRSSDLVDGVADGNSQRDVFAYDVNSGDKEVISLEVAEGISGNAASNAGMRQSISDDGRFHVFTSRASNLASGVVDANDRDDVYLYDAVLGTTTLVSVTPQGSSGNSKSDQPVISNDGKFVAFRSFGDGFVPNDNNGTTDVYVYDRVAGIVSLVSESLSGNSGNSRSFSPSISGDGSVISFTSEASDLVSGVTNSSRTDNIFVRNTLLGTTALASSNQTGTSTGNQDSFDAIVSQNGSTVVFESKASDLVPGINDNNNSADVFAYDVATGNRENLSFDPTASTSRASFDPDLNDDGSMIVFASRANLTANDDNGETDVFVVNRNIPSIELVSVNGTGTNSGSDDSLSPRISGDGNFVVFESLADDLAAPDSNSGRDIFLRNLIAGTTELVSVNLDGTNGAGALGSAMVSDDGRFVVFHSASTTLVTVPTTGGGLQHVYLRDTTAQQTILIDTDNNGTVDANYQSFRPVISADGSRIVFDTNAPNSLDVNFTDLNGVDSDVYSHRVDVSDISLGTNDLVSRKSPGLRVTGDGTSWFPSVSDDGRFVAFASEAGFLTDIPSNGDVYVRDRDNQTTEMISINADGTAGGNNRSRVSQISGDGNTVVFQSSATDLAPGDTSSSADIYVRDLSNSSTELVSINADGDGATGNATNPSISDDGRFVAFQSASPAVIGGVPTTFGRTHLVLRDTVNDQSKLITVNAAGSEAGASSFTPHVSGSGNRVIFWTEASDLIGSEFIDINFGGDVYLHDINGADISLGNNELVSRKAANLKVTPAQGLTSIDGPFPYDLNDDGSIIVFNSDGNGMVPNDTNFRDDIFLIDRSSNQLELISESTTGLAAGLASIPRISGDGQIVVFISTSNFLTPMPTSNITNVFAYDRSLETIELISTNNDGDRGGNDRSEFPSISDDGRYIAFRSEATDLVDDSIVMNSRNSIFLHDRMNSQTALISIDVSGTLDGNRQSPGAVVSGNGNTVTFVSEATNLVGADFIDINGSGGDDVYLHDIDSDDVTNGTNRIISGRPIGVDFTGDSGATDPDVSNDGQSVVFESRAELLTLDQSVSNNRDIFLRDRSSDTTQLVSVSRFGSRDANRSSKLARISGDGNSVLFISRATDLVPVSVSSSIDDIFLRDISAGTTELISIDRDGSGANNQSANPSISDDGRFVAFLSFATDLVPNGIVVGFGINIFLRDTDNDQTALISMNRAGTADANGFSFSPSISSDGSRILFGTGGTDLGDVSLQDINGASSDVYSHRTDFTDILLGENQLVSGKAAGLLITGNRQSGNPDVSDDGQIVAFESLASGLTANDIRFNADVFARDRSNNTTELVSINSAGTGPGNRDSADPRISGDGNTVVFESLASDLSPIDSGGQQDIFAHQRDTATTKLISQNNSGSNGGNSTSQDASVSDDGRFVVFTSLATDLVPSGVTTSQPNVYFRDRQESAVELVSQNSVGSGEGNGSSFNPSISDNGITIVFESDATDLVAESDANSATDVFFVINSGITDLSILAIDADRAEGNDGVTPFRFEVTRSGDTTGSTTVDVQLAGGGVDSADANDFSGIMEEPSAALFSNQDLPLDVSHDGVVTARDALLVLNTLHRAGIAPADAPDVTAAGFVDPSGDGLISAQDALVIINAIGRDSQPPELTVDSSSNGMLSGRAIDQTGVARVMARIDNTYVANVPVNPDGTFSFQPASLLERISGGEHRVSLVAVDGIGNQSSPQEFAFTINAAGIDPAMTIATTSVTFAAGEATKIITVNVNGDIDFESDEGFAVHLAPVSTEAQISQAAADGTIRNDDLPVGSGEVNEIIYFNQDAGIEKDLTADQTGQRSIIRGIQVAFDGPVDVVLGPVSDQSFVVESTDLATSGVQVGLHVVSSELVGSQQVVVLGFTGTDLIEDSSENQQAVAPMLQDGRYRLIVSGDQFNGDDPGTDKTDEFFRLFGDSDGDADTDSVDSFRFRQHSFSGADNDLFDFDADEQLSDADDLTEFFSRFGKTI